MMAYDRSGGALFKNDSENVKAPVYQGDATITKGDMRVLLEAVQAGKDAKVKVAAFRREGRKGPFLSLALTPWATHEKEQAAWRAKRGDTSDDGFYVTAKGNQYGDNGGDSGSDSGSEEGKSDEDPWAF